MSSTDVHSPGHDAAAGHERAWVTWPAWPCQRGSYSVAWAENDPSPGHGSDRGGSRIRTGVRFYG